MGNRAVITTRDRELALYVHWNGGRQCIEGFLKYCEIREFRPPETDSYGWARLCQVIANYFGAEGLHVGIAPYTDDSCSDPGDNGIYVISNWRIVEHFGGIYDHEKVDEDFDMARWLEAIDERQPEGQRLGPDGLRAPLVPRGDLRVGDRIIARDIGNEFRRVTVYAVQRFPDNPDFVSVFADFYKNAYGAPEQTIHNALTRDAYRRIG